MAGRARDSKSASAQRGARRPGAAKPATKARTPHPGFACDELLSIGELASRTHVSTRTIRYYEEVGILPVPPRSVGGTRRYPKKYVFYVEGARALKQLGFSLEEIAELGKYALEGTAPFEQTQALLRDRVSELEHRIRVLRRLHALVVEAAAEGAGSRAPILTLLHWLGSEDSTEPDALAEAGRQGRPAAGLALTATPTGFAGRGA